MDNKELLYVIGKNLARERSLRNLPLMEVSKSTGVSISTLSRIENSKISISVVALVALSNYYNTSVDALLLWDKQENVTTAIKMEETLTSMLR